MSDISGSRTAGAALRAAREEKGMSLAALSEKTGIALQDLGYCEADNYARLPADLYVRNFLERCAFALGIPPEHLLDVYHPPAALMRPVAGGTAARLLNRELTVTPRIMFGAMFLFMGAAIGLYFWYQVSMLVGPPTLVVTNPPRDIMTQDAFVTIAGRTKPESHVFVNDTEVTVGATGAFRDIVALLDGMNIIEVRSVSKFGEEIEVTRRIIKN
ncbi:MAG: helix-turn-helix domain-containing protein [Patescibacteria group bacterium]